MKFALLPFIFSVLGSIAEASQLIGVWQQGCSNRTFRTENFRASDVTYQENYFGDGLCQNALLQFSISGPYRVEAGIIDFQATAYRATVKNAALVSQYNSRKVCGWTNWSLEQPRDVSGLACDFFGYGAPLMVPPAGTWRYGIYKIEGGFLYFGQLTRDEDGATPQRRPSAWNPSFYRKIH